jgi:hypothetical protein
VIRGMMYNDRSQPDCVEADNLLIEHPASAGQEENYVSHNTSSTPTDSIKFQLP